MATLATLDVLSDSLLDQNFYQGYSYSYPHKTAYRTLQPAMSLQDVWARESKHALQLYVHLPFCEMRCGFCNLFTQAQPAEEIVARYMESLRIQSSRVARALGPVNVAKWALGGGTPTYLAVNALEKLFSSFRADFSVDPRAIPTSIEASPGTVTVEKLALLREVGVERVSMGVQSFLDGENEAIGRHQPLALLETALERLRAARFPIVNLDLIYGLPRQTVAGWLTSMDKALEYAPEEIFLYPLYVRPMTGLDKMSTSPRALTTVHSNDSSCRPPSLDFRLECYREARLFLLARGYTQISMRVFRAPHAPAPRGSGYRCQDDGMIGLGCGARSYTRGLHYAHQFAVGHQAVRAVIDDYLETSAESFSWARHGFALDIDEQKRRYLIQSLLQCEGIDTGAYHERFHCGLCEDFPHLVAWEKAGWIENADGRIRLTSQGLERSDQLGPALYSARVRALMEDYAWR